MTQTPEEPTRYPRHEIHDRIYTGTHAAKLVLEHDAEADDIINEFEEYPSVDPGDHIYFLRREEFEKYDGEELYGAAPLFTRRRAGLENPRFWPGSAFKEWLRNEASDAEIVNFFQGAFHNLRKTAITPEIESLVETQMSLYAQGIASGEDQGWLAPGSAMRIKGYKDNPESWRWGTSQMIANPRAAAWSVGYMPPRDSNRLYTPQVVFPASTMPKYFNFEAEPGVIAEKIKSKGFHEFNHAFLGGFDRKWVNEAVTEHISRVLRGEVDIEGKQYASEIEGAYGKEIKLLLTMINRSQKDPDTALSMKDVTLAYSSLDAQALKDVSQRFKKAIGYSFEETDELLAAKTMPSAKYTAYVDTQSESYSRAINDLTEQLAT